MPVIQQMSDGTFVKVQSPDERALIQGLFDEEDERKAADGAIEVEIDETNVRIDELNNTIADLKYLIQTILNGNIKSIKIQDTRNVASVPSDYSNESEWHLKDVDMMQVPDPETGLAIVLGCGDDSDEESYEIAFCSTGSLYTRNGSRLGQWGAWSKIFTSLDSGAGSGINADMVDSHHAGNAANNVLVLDSQGFVPVANLKQFLTGISADMVDQLHAADLLGKPIVISSPASDQYYYVATLPASTTSTYDKLLIEFMGGGWDSGSLTREWMLMSNREQFKVIYGRDGSFDRTKLCVKAYSQADGSVKVYIKGKSGQYASAMVKAQGIGFNDALNVGIVIGTASTTVPTGVSTVFDSSTATPDFGSELYPRLTANNTWLGKNTFTGNVKTHLQAEFDATEMTAGWGALTADTGAFSGQAFYFNQGASPVVKTVCSVAYNNLRYGRYSVGVRMKSTSTSTAVVATFKVFNNSNTQVATLDIKGSDFIGANIYTVFYLPFINDGTSVNNNYQFSVTATAIANLGISVDSIFVTPVHTAAFYMKG